MFADTNTCLGTGGIMNRPNGMNNKGLLTGHRRPKLAWHVLCRFPRPSNRLFAAERDGGPRPPDSGNHEDFRPERY